MYSVTLRENFVIVALTQNVVFDHSVRASAFSMVKTTRTHKFLCTLYDDMANVMSEHEKSEETKRFAIAT